MASPSTTATPSVYTGTLYKPIGGPPFEAPFGPTLVTGTPVGAGTLTFADGNHATFAYDVEGVAQSKEITREVFDPPGTVCR